MNILYLDYETYSPIPIEHGSIKYLNHLDADIVCLGYKINNGVTRIWEPNSKIPPIFRTSDLIVYAHNAIFDYRVHSIIGKIYGFPEIPLKNWRDSMALCGRYTVPLALEKACEVMQLRVNKDKKGKTLIKKICIPDEKGIRPSLNIDFSKTDLNDFYNYCITDIDAMYELIHSFPSNQLSDSEQEQWYLTQLINNRGLPIDSEAVDSILRYITVYIEECTTLLPELTNNKVTKPTQVKRILDYCKDYGIKLPNLQAPTVTKYLEKNNLPKSIKTILALRQELGKSSIAKYVKLQNLVYKKRVHDNLCYHVASTGRWGGRGFQLHNLPRASVKDPNLWIQKFKNIDEIEDPVQIAKALIRPMIKAPVNQSLLVSDYTAIEYILLCWTANDKRAIQLYNNKEDQYKDMASSLYNIPYETVPDDLRRVGKVIILGCGYGMGSNQFRTVAKSYSINLSSGEAVEAVDAYRYKYKLIRNMWYKLANCAKAAIINKSTAYKTNKCIFKVVRDKNNTEWLQLMLPSNRALYYMKPEIGQGRFGSSIFHMGINSYTKKWDKLELIPGRITENIIQGIARDVLAEGIKNIENKMPEVKIIGDIHDEAIGLINNSDINSSTLNKFNKLLCHCTTMDINIYAKGYISKRYKKG